MTNPQLVSTNIGEVQEMLREDIRVLHITACGQDDKRFEQFDW
jgi:hypothetical protein